MILLQALYFMLPAYVANMVPVFATKIWGNRCSSPVDFNARFRGKPLLGTHKTWRGLITGVIAGILIAYLQKSLYEFQAGRALSLFDYESGNVLLLGFLLGFGALLGDMVKSFIKRQMNVSSGAKFFPWDQMDFIVGALVLVSFLYIPQWEVIVIILICSPFLHIGANRIGHLLKIKNTPW